MVNPDWLPFNDGVTIGTKGSEYGTIAHDQEHPLGARLTLEGGGQTAPFAITCGVYGWMVHTRFFETEAEANVEFDRMKMPLAQLLVSRSQENGGTISFTDRMAAFVEAYS